MIMDFVMVDITPTKNMLMSGYLGALYAHLLRLDDHVIIACDLIGVDQSIVAALRARLPHLSIDIFANHTHAGPVGTILTDRSLEFMVDVFQGFDLAYSLFLISTLEMGIKALSGSEGKISHRHFINHGIAAHRHQYGLSFDDNINLFEFKNETQTVVLVQLALHPTYLKEDNTLYSNDLLFEVEAILKKGL